MKNILLARIDDRLIHGQVVAKWAKKLFFTHIYVVDDAVSQDVFLCQIMKSIAPKDITVKILDTQAAIKALTEEGGADEKICILVKVPQTFENLIEGGVDLKEIMLGGMGAKEGRKSLIRSVSINDEERDSLKRMIGKGIHVFYQDVPDTRPTDLSKKL